MSLCICKLVVSCVVHASGRDICIGIGIGPDIDAIGFVLGPAGIFPSLTRVSTCSDSRDYRKYPRTSGFSVSLTRAHPPLTERAPRSGMRVSVGDRRGGDAVIMAAVVAGYACGAGACFWFCVSL
eukprot:1300215-Amorphochlora_amoeboformis.AAC.1